MANILIVEDSPTDAYALRRILERDGHEVTVAADGEQGVKCARDEHPDVILMDIVLPRLNGFQATRELHKHGPTADIPIILVSTKDQRTDRLWGLRQGAVDYLPKPVDHRTLLASVNQAMAGIELMAEEAVACRGKESTQ